MFPAECSAVDVRGRMQPGRAADFSLPTETECIGADDGNGLVLRARIERVPTLCSTPGSAR